MPATDVIPAFLEGDRTDGAPWHRYPRSECREMKRKGEGYFVSNGKVFMVSRPREIEIPVTGLLGKGVIPFARIPNPMQRPERIHYPIPACADHRLSWRYRFMIQDEDDERLTNR